MRQLLGMVLCGTMTLANCLISREGNSLCLSAVRFLSCEFYFSSDMPTYIVSKLHLSNGKAVTISWSRVG